MNVRLACVVAILAGALPGLAYPQAPADVAEQISLPAPGAVPATPEAPTLGVPGSVSGVIADGGSPPGTVSAVWVAKEVSFTYFSSTSLYYCDGLRTKVKWVMQQLGLMDGYKVRIRSCFNSSGPEIRYGPAGPEFYSGAEGAPRVVIEAVVPQRVTSELLAKLDEREGERELIARVRGESVVDNAEAQFAASTRRVTFDDASRRGRIESGDCELIEQMRDQVFVPLGFKIVEDKMTCMPNRVQRGSVNLQVEILEPWTPEPEPGQPADPGAVQ